MSVSRQAEAPSRLGGLAPQLVDGKAEARRIAQALVIQTLDHIPFFQWTAATCVQLGIAQRFHFGLQTKTDAQRTVASARPFGSQPAVARFQIDRRAVSRAFHIEEKHQILMAQRPSRHHQWLALAHAQEGTGLHRAPANPQR